MNRRYAEDEQNKREAAHAGSAVAAAVCASRRVQDKKSSSDIRMRSVCTYSAAPGDAGVVARPTKWQKVCLFVAGMI